RAELGAAVLRAAGLDELGASVGARLRPGQVLTILDDQGTVIRRFPSNGANPAAAPGPHLMQKIIEQGSAIFEAPDLQGQPRLYAIKKTLSPVGTAVPLTVAVSISKKAVHEDGSRSLLQILSGIAAFTLILISGALYAAERLILRPIRALLEMTRQVRAGDLNARTAIRPSHEELSQLGAALDEMADQLQTRDAKLQDALRDLREQAITDPLTGLYNRRYFWEALGREILTVRRKGTPFSVILLDIDRFKHVNDTWGHDAGDAVLKAVADVIRSSVRGSDIAVRYGGEEFAILMPEATAEVAEERAHALRQGLQDLETACASRKIKITGSFGVAEYRERMGAGGALMKEVDEAMYAAKAGGRNRVVMRAACSPSSLPSPSLCS
ncbi:MAG: sensor domain-containing diguanylate cyclase, partial [Burkholderiales bacterium]